MARPTQAKTEALQILRSLSGVDDQGYVTLNPVPYRAHHLLLEEVLAHSRPGDVVFEGGVSSGYFAQAITLAGREVDGHELDPSAAVAAKEHCRQVWVGDLQDFGVTEELGEYQVLLFGDTLEHIVDPVTVLQRLRRHLTPGGRLVVSVPNVANWAIRLQLAAGRFRYTDRGILDRTHLRFYTASTLAEMVTEAGFAVDRVQAAVPMPGVTQERACRLVHMVGNLRPSLFAYNLILTAHR
jgi:2-polyprenyl-3-methyl-5-hydroxy-6-metoxy-1,4-benzoquinol methylase